jgi:hypothetical protein
MITLSVWPTKYDLVTQFTLPSESKYLTSPKSVMFLIPFSIRRPNCDKGPPCCTWHAGRDRIYQAQHVRDLLLWVLGIMVIEPKSRIVKYMCCLAMHHG